MNTPTPLKNLSGISLSEAQAFGAEIAAALRAFTHVDNTAIYQKIQKVLDAESKKLGAELDRREEENEF